MEKDAGRDRSRHQMCRYDALDRCHRMFMVSTVKAPNQNAPSTVLSSCFVLIGYIMFANGVLGRDEEVRVPHDQLVAFEIRSGPSRPRLEFGAKGTRPGTFFRSRDDMNRFETEEEPIPKGSNVRICSAEKIDVLLRHVSNKSSRHAKPLTSKIEEGRVFTTHFNQFERPGFLRCRNALGHEAPYSSARWIKQDEMPADACQWESLLGQVLTTLTIAKETPIIIPFHDYFFHDYSFHDYLFHDCFFHDYFFHDYSSRG